MSERYRVMLLFGGPGVGKGTQGKLLGGVPGFHHLSTGDMFRTLDPDSELGQTFLSYSTKGDLVPNDLTACLWEKHVDARHTLGKYRPHRDLLVLDGIPRNLEQCRLLEPHIEVQLIVHLDAPDREIIFERLRQRAIREGRPDDADDTVIRKRWQVYDDETRPVLDHYGPSLVATIDPIGTVPEVLARVLARAAAVQATLATG